METKSKIQASTIAREIIDKYNLQDTGAQQIEDVLRKKIMEICKGIKVLSVDNEETDLWTKSESKSTGKKKAKDKAEDEKKTKRRIQHYFTETERDMILASPELYEYIIKRLLGKATEYDIARDEAERANRAEQEIDWDEFRQYVSDCNEPVITYGDVEEMKFKIMLEAIYLKFFEPVDEQKLRHDMEMSIVPSGVDATPQTMMALRRLRNGHNYYKERK